MEEEKLHLAVRQIADFEGSALVRQASIVSEDTAFQTSEEAQADWETLRARLDQDTRQGMDIQIDAMKWDPEMFERMKQRIRFTSAAGLDDWRCDKRL